MASSPLEAVDSHSIDTAGISVATSPRTFANSRYGTIYDPVTLAGCTPVLFTPLDGSDYLMLYSRRWINGVVSGANPGHYTSYSISNEPGWLILNGSTGVSRMVDGDPNIPMNTPHTSATLVDACSRPPHYIYTLNTVTGTTGTSAVVQHLFYNQSIKTFNIQAEETVPNGYTRPVGMTEAAWAALSSAQKQAQGAVVRFDRGVYFATPYLIVFGASPTGQLFTARKNWGWIGYPAYGWEYFTGDGWASEPTSASQVQSTTGPMTTAGPVSVLNYQNRIRLATVVASGNNRYGQVWVATNYHTWRPTGSPILLGSVADGSYQGGTLQFQPQMAAVDTLVNTPSAAWAIPFCYTTKTFELGSSSLKVNWSLWQVSRLF